VFGLVGEWGPAEGAWAGSGAMEASRHEAVIFPTTQKILGENFGCNSLVPVFFGHEAKVTIGGSLHLSFSHVFLRGRYWPVFACVDEFVIPQSLPVLRTRTTPEMLAQPVYLQLLISRKTVDSEALKLCRRLFGKEQFG
jgi:hypothetical protein